MISPDNNEATGSCSVDAETLERFQAMGANILSGTVLDIGGRDGCYGGLLRKLGADRLHLIDPNHEELLGGVALRSYASSDVHAMTIEEWLIDPANVEAADGAAVLNVMPYLGPDISFWTAVYRSVRPGGTVLTSQREPVTSLTVVQALQEVGLVEITGQPPKSAQPLQASIPRPNAFIHVWRKPDDTL
jgi:hypothetical protein